MEKFNSTKVTLQSLLLKRSGRFKDTTYFDDTDSLSSMGSENRFQRRATLYGRSSSFIRGYSTVASNSNEAQSAQQQFPKTTRQSLYNRKKEPSPESEQNEDQGQTSDKQRQATSWLRRMRPSLYRRREQIPSGDDTAGLMATSQSAPTGEDRLLGDYSEVELDDSEDEPEDPEESVVRQHEINAMYWSAKIKDELTTQLLTNTNVVTIDH